MTPEDGPAGRRDRMVAVGVSTLGGVGGRCVAARIGPVTGHSVAGPAFTVTCAPADNMAIHVALTRAPRGSVLVVDASARPEFGFWGEILTVAAQQAGIVGLVIDGCVRDVDRLDELGFPVFAAGISASGTTKNAGGSAGAPASVGGVLVQSGDWVVGDRDGVVVIAGGDLDTVLVRGEQKSAWEAGVLASLREGRTTVELFDLDPAAVCS